jgi:hypothetical protein
MSTQNPEVDVAAFYASAELGLTLGTNLFRGKVLAVGQGVPAAALFVEGQDAEPPQPFLGTGTSYWTGDVDVTARGPPGDRRAAFDAARAALQAFHLATLPGYVRVVSLSSLPRWVEEDEAGCHEYRFTLSLEWEG